MNNGEIIVFVVIVLFAAAALVISVLQFLQKGFLFNNAYIWATDEQRKKLDKKPHYRQSAIVFLFISLTFSAAALGLLTGRKICYIIEYCLILFVLVYAVVSSVRLEKRSKKQ